MDMNVQILKDGNDITPKVISYERNLSICTGIGTLNVTLELVSGIDFYPWDEITLYEEGVKKGIFLVSDITKDSHLATISISCLDFSKKLLEYYVTDVYEIDYISYTRYWLELFLDQAGVNYSINVAGNGSIMSNNTSIGPEQAYDIVLRLLQMSGWYMYFDADGICQIGTLTIDTDNYDHSFIGTTQVISIATNKNDQMLRNRAVVWGASDPITEQWVYADRSVDTPYNYDSLDKRAAVLANSNIDSVGAANVLAGKMLNEFARITYEKTITLIGAPNVLLGQVVFVSTAKKSTVGMVTSLTSSMSSSGLTTVLVLDQRCPRLFGYYGYLGYVYVGTYGSGVWRKLIEGSTWSDFSTGITDLHVIDLYIRDGIFACVTGDGNGYYRNLNLSAWQMVEKPTLYYTDEFDQQIEVQSTDVKIIGCTVTPEANIEYIAIYKHDEEIYGFNKSWVLEYSPLGVFIRSSIITLPDLENQLAIDIDGNNESNIITTKISNRSIIVEEGDDGAYGTRASHPYDGKMIPSLPPVTHPEYQMALVGSRVKTFDNRRQQGNVFIQNTAEDLGIYYHFYMNTVGVYPNSVTTCYFAKGVFVEKSYDYGGDDFGVYGYWTEGEADGGFQKTFPYTDFGVTVFYGDVKAFHVIDDDHFTLLIWTSYLGSSSGKEEYKLFRYSRDYDEETEQYVVETSIEVILALNDSSYKLQQNPIYAHGKVAFIINHPSPLGWSYKYLDGHIIDMTTGQITSSINMGIDEPINLFMGAISTYPSSYQESSISDGVLSGHTISYLCHRTDLNNNKVLPPNPGGAADLFCGVNESNVAMKCFGYVIRFNLANSSISVVTIGGGDGELYRINKVEERENTYTTLGAQELARSSWIVVNQNVVEGTATVRLTINKPIARQFFTGYWWLLYFGGCSYSRTYSEQFIFSFNIELPSGNITYVHPTSYLKWTVWPGPYSPFTYPENFEVLDIKEPHRGDIGIHNYKFLYSNNDTPIVTDKAGNFNGGFTGSYVFRDGITFEIISGIEAPVGLGEDLEYKTTVHEWNQFRGELNYPNDAITILGTIGLQDEVDGTRYLVIGKWSSINKTFTAYLVGYDSVGNITKRFYSPNTRNIWNELTQTYQTVNVHSESAINSGINSYDFTSLDLQGNILYEKSEKFYISGRVPQRVFHKFFDYEAQQLLQDRYLVLRQDYSNFDSFTQIQEHTFPMRVDISKEAPTVIYSRVVGSGVSSITRTSYTNAVDDYNFVDATRRIPVHEARSFSVMDEDNFYIYSGSLDEIAFDYVLVASNTDVRFIESSLAGEWNTLASFGELVSHVETTNFTDNPYFFISTSGETASSFYQRNNDGVSFIQYNSGLPSGSGITIIRTDDRI